MPIWEILPGIKKHKRLWTGFLSLFLVGLLWISAAQSPLFAQGGNYSLTIFVEEGAGELNGHVFLSISDGNKNEVLGFYSKNKLLAVASMGGGEIRDDSKTNWDVRKTYQLTKQGYIEAKRAIQKWRSEDEAWWVNHHCGDFVETVAKAARVGPDLPWTATGRNRPGIFGEYLRAHGGETKEASKDKFKKIMWGAPLETVNVLATTGEPFFSKTVLKKGEYYLIEATGEFSCWSDKDGGVDAFYCFAEWRVGPKPVAWKQLLLDDVPMFDLATQYGFDTRFAPEPEHMYKSVFEGKGKVLKLQIADAIGSSSDNKKGLKVTIFEKMKTVMDY
jgi:hypothetical protein